MPDLKIKLRYGCYEAISSETFRPTPSQRRLLDKVDDSEDVIFKINLLRELNKINKNVYCKILSIEDEVRPCSNLNKRTKKFLKNTKSDKKIKMKKREEKRRKPRYKTERYRCKYSRGYLKNN